MEFPTFTSNIVRFYTECFGMKLLRKRDIPEEKYSNAFLGFGPEETNFVVELTYSMFRLFIFIPENPIFVILILYSCQLFEKFNP